jgi:AraC family L-rhamnose operon transcriptional activator RhaR
LKSPVTTFNGERFFQRNPHLFINRATETFDSRYHMHDFVEFAFVAEGQGFHHIGEEVQRVYKGQLFIIPIGVSHVFRPASANVKKHPLIVYNSVFTLAYIDYLSTFCTDQPVIQYLQMLKSDNRLSTSIHDVDGRIEQLMYALHREFSVPQSGSNTYLSTLFLQLIITMYRLQHKETLAALGKQPPFLAVLRVLEQHYQESITLSQLAAECQWSERHLQRLFHQHTGQSFSYYLQNLRIQKSCEQLRSSQLTIRIIAESVGYQDMDSFIRVFKKIVGCTPSEYRSRSRTGKQTLST